MLEMDHIDHVGIRISDRSRSVAFYELIGFELIADGGYENGHPLVMVHPSGININLPMGLGNGFVTFAVPTHVKTWHDPRLDSDTWSRYVDPECRAGN